MICKKCGIYSARTNHVTCQVCYLDIKTGKQFKLVLPSPLPNYVIQDPIWKDHLLTNDQGIVDIFELPATRDVDGRSVTFVIARTLFRCVTTHLLNTSIIVDWLYPINTQISCNCPLDIILKTGCKNKNHV